MLYLAVLRSRMLKARQFFHWSANKDMTFCYCLGWCDESWFSLSALIFKIGLSTQDPCHGMTAPPWRSLPILRRALRRVIWRALNHSRSSRKR
jgi:hypothetical protein